MRTAMPRLTRSHPPRPVCSLFLRQARTRILSTIWLATLVSCSTTGGARQGADAMQSATIPRFAGSSRVVGPAEFAPLGGMSVYEALVRLRPEFLQSNRGASGAERAVYVDGSRFDGIENLRWIRSEAVRQVRWLTETEAASQFHGRHPGGAVVVITSARR